MRFLLLILIVFLAQSRHSLSQDAVDFDLGKKGTIRVNHPCERDWQCIDKAFCQSQMSCRCEPNYAPGPDLTKCHATAGANCQTNADCATMANAECVQGVCRCQNNYILDFHNNSNCIMTPRQPGDICQTNDHCTEIMLKSLCVGEKCKCIEGFRFTNATGTCVETRGIHQPCRHDSECYESKMPHDLYCKNNECAFTEKFLANGALSKFTTARILGIFILSILTIL